MGDALRVAFSNILERILSLSLSRCRAAKADNRRGVLIEAIVITSTMSQVTVRDADTVRY